MTMETTQLFILLFEVLLTIAIAMGGFIVKGMHNRITTLEANMIGMRTNYLDRFAEVISKQNEAKESLIISQNEVKQELLAQQTVIKEELVGHNTETKLELISAIHKIELSLAGKSVKEN